MFNDYCLIGFRHSKTHINRSGWVERIVASLIGAHCDISGSSKGQHVAGQRGWTRNDTKSDRLARAGCSSQVESGVAIGMVANGRKGNSLTLLRRLVDSGDGIAASVTCSVKGCHSQNVCPGKKWDTAHVPTIKRSTDRTASASVIRPYDASYTYIIIRTSAHLGGRGGCCPCTAKDRVCYINIRRLYIARPEGAYTAI